MSENVQVASGRRGLGSPDLDRKVFVRPIAHRGLHDANRGRVENTAPAFLAAIEKNYGIECDLQAAADGTPMVFHDTKLDRLVAASGLMAHYTPARLARFHYRGQSERILTFAQFLQLVDGRVPVLAEVKANASAGRSVFLEKIARVASTYHGPIALMSFNRSMVAELGVRAPKVPRGRVVGSTQLLASLWRRRRSASPARSRLLEPVRDGIAFYAVDVRLAAVARTWLTRNGLDLPLFAWTVRTARQRALAARWADAPIFEGFEP